MLLRKYKLKADQKYTPKYWVGHSKEQDDIIVCTMSKTRSDAINEMEFLFGEDWFLDGNYEVILVEIKMVNV